MKRFVDRLIAFCRIYALGVTSQAISGVYFRAARSVQSIADSTRVVSTRRRCEIGDIRIFRWVVEQRENAIMRRSFRLGSVIKYRDYDIVTISSVSVFAFSRVLLCENACAASGPGTKTSDSLAKRRQRRVDGCKYFFLLTFVMR